MNRRNFTKATLSSLAIASVGIPAMASVSDVDDEGPHLRYDMRTDEEPFPGCEIVVFKEHWPIPCVYILDTRARTITRAGMALVDIPLEDVDRRISWKDGDREYSSAEANSMFVHIPKSAQLLIDGLPQGEWHDANLRTLSYDTVMLRGPAELLMKYVEERRVPRGWLLLSPSR
jgi:hypothetical protein